jgi:hypothetical protein
MIFAKVSFTSKPLTAWGASEFANSHWETVYNSKARVTAGLLYKFLPKSFFQLPEIGCLANKSGSMNKSKSREEMGVVTTKVVQQSLVLAKPEILANDFDGEDFAISKARLRPTLAQPLLAKMAVDSIVNKAEHSYNESIQVQGRRPPIVGLAITIEEASSWTFNFNPKTCTWRYYLFCMSPLTAD